MAAPPVLDMQGVGRAFPPDVGESAAAIWREMLLPRRWLARAGAHGLPVLEGIDLVVPPGQCIGVLGAHRSGKSTLAAIAAGLLAPTAGRVARPRRCVMLARPAAGFKPGLTVRENLRLLGVLHGHAGAPLARLLDDVLARCGVSAAQADAATGNLSPHLVRPLALSLLLALPADLLVVDDLATAGTGDLRWALRGQLRERLHRGASLVLSADACFLLDVASRVHLLERGRLTGPFDAHEAPGLYRPWSSEGALVPAEEGDEAEETGEIGEIGEIGDPQQAPPWKLLRIAVDGEDFSRSRYSLLRRPGDRLRVELDLRSSIRQWFTGGRFELHGGSSGVPVGRWDAREPEALVQAGDPARLCFHLRVPDAGEDFCGLSFTPAWRRKHYLLDHRLKVLIYGVGRRHARAGLARLDIARLSFTTERSAPHAPAPAAVPAKGVPSARQPV